MTSAPDAYMRAIDVPTVTAISPTVATHGTSVTLTITGTNFLNGATVVACEGLATVPPDRLWAQCERHGVSILLPEPARRLAAVLAAVVVESEKKEEPKAEEKKADEKNLKVGVGLMIRHCHARQELYKRITDGAVGDIIAMQIGRAHV